MVHLGSHFRAQTSVPLLQKSFDSMCNHLKYKFSKEDFNNFVILGSYCLMWRSPGLGFNHLLPCGLKYSSAKGKDYTSRNWEEMFYEKQIPSQMYEHMS